MTTDSFGCPFGEYPERPHEYEAIYLEGREAPAIFCQRCGDTRLIAVLAKEQPVEDRVEWAQQHKAQ